MSNICRYDVCCNKHIYKTADSALICVNGLKKECIMDFCGDFDAVIDEKNVIHIIASDRGGNLIYIRNENKRWGRGMVTRALFPKNLFLLLDDKKIKVCFMSGKKLFLQIIDEKINSPCFAARVSGSVLPFVSENGIFFVNENGVLCRNNVELFNGENITELFAVEHEIYYKESDCLKCTYADNPQKTIFLTRKHKNGAESPVVIAENDERILCWHDDNTVFFAKHVENEWKRLKKLKLGSGEQAFVYKICDNKKIRYNMGVISGGKVYSLKQIINEREQKGYI